MFKYVFIYCLQYIIFINTYRYLDYINKFSQIFNLSHNYKKTCFLYFNYIFICKYQVLVKLNDLSIHTFNTNIFVGKLPTQEYNIRANVSRMRDDFG